MSGSRESFWARELRESLGRVRGELAAAEAAWRVRDGALCELHLASVRRSASNARAALSYVRRES